MFNVDFSAITTVNNNANFKIRLRFTGTNMTADTGARITFNNFAVNGTQTLAVEENAVLNLSVFPNPFTDVVNIVGINVTQNVSFKLFSVDGKVIYNGEVENNQINLNHISSGIYMLQLSSDDKSEIMKIIKR